MSSRRACALCRRRKVKCDGLPTCGNCNVAKVSCQYSPPKKRGPKPVKWHGGSPQETLASSSVTIDSPEGSETPGASAAASSCNYTELSLQSPSPNAPTTNPLFEAPDAQTRAAVNVHLALLTGLLAVAPSESAVSIASRCILLYTQYVFGTAPVCHEPTLRVTVDRFFIPLSNGANDADDHARVSGCFAAGGEWERVSALRGLTLLTALCAAVTYVVPEAVLPNKQGMAPLLLRASRDTLKIYEDHDLEHPDSSSLSIRLFLSSAIQTATGTHGLAFHSLSEAGLIAMRMRLYDERSLEGLEPVEESLLRNAFWQLYTCDKTALVMRGRPVTIHETLFESELTIKSHSPTPVPLFDHGQDPNGAEIETRLLEGFHVIRRLWTMAAHVIQGMESRSRHVLDAQVDTGASREDTTQLSAAYFEMVSLTNELPTLVRPAAGSSPSDSRDADQRLYEVLQRQRTSYLITLHSIKVFMLHTAIRCNMTSVMGLSAEPMALAMRQIELAQDFLNVLESVSFLHLQAEGEQCVEKIRRVGSLLLELAHGAENETVKRHANQCAMHLIDMLVRLDSKASDVLGWEMGLSTYELH